MYEKTNTGAVKKYYTAFGRTIAIRDVPTGSGAGTMYYPVPDHLGSTSTVLDANGSLVSSQRYWPYGATRSGSVTQTDRLYTGQRQEPGDAAMGLYNYKARFYSTTLGRFVSADSLVMDGLNRYQYVRGNPLSYTDPTGRCALGRQRCTPQEWGWYIDCALGEDCEAPDGVTLSDWRRFTAWAAGQDEFWQHYDVHKYRAPLLTENVVMGLAHGWSPSYYDVIPPIGWSKVAEQVGVTPVFLRASLFALVFGYPNSITSLGRADTVGNYAWWKVLHPASFTLLYKQIGWNAVYADDVWLAFVERTIAVAHELTTDGVTAAEINSLAWTQQQREILHGNGYASIDTFSGFPGIRHVANCELCRNLPLNLPKLIPGWPATQ